MLYTSLARGGRRTFASRLLAAGASLETVQALLGHADLYGSEADIIFAQPEKCVKAKATLFDVLDIRVM